MDESESKNEKPKEERQFSKEQYEMLKVCSDKKDMTEWNDWRKEHPGEDIWLQGREFQGWWLKKANFMHGTYNGINYSGEVHLEGSIFEKAHLEEAEFFRAHLEGGRFQHAKARGTSFNEAHLENAKLSVAHLEDCNFAHAFLENVDLISSFLNGSKFSLADLRGCQVRVSVVDGATRFWKCKINKYSRNERFTDFSGIALDNVIIDPATKQLLEYNIRRMNWEVWYKYKNWQGKQDERHIVTQKLMWFIRRFWEISDYGISTKKVIKTFFRWALVFALIYYAWGFIDYYFVGIKDYPGIVRDLFVLEDNQEAVSCWLVPFRAVYFSIVTMTTLGFGDMYANAHNFLRGLFGHALLALQVILGYVLLGALVTRFAVLFTAGGPAGKFSD